MSIRLVLPRTPVHPNAMRGRFRTIRPVVEMAAARAIVSTTFAVTAALVPLATEADSESLPTPRGFAVLAEHGPGQWGDFYIPDGWVSDRTADGLRAGSIVNTIMPPLTDADRERGYLVFNTHYCDQVLPERTPMPQDLIPPNLDRPLTITATPGEYEPGSFCIRSLHPLKGLRVSVAAVEGTDGARIPVNHIDLRQVRYMPRAVDTERKKYALRPSYLEKRTSTDLPGNMTIQYWLTIKIPGDQVPGEYRGRVEIKADNALPSGLNIRVDVLPFHLEEPPTIYAMYHLHSGTWRHLYHHLPGALDRHCEDMAAHGMNGVITYGTPEVVSTKDGLRIDFESVSSLSSTPISFADQVRGYVRAGLDHHVCWYTGDMNLTLEPFSLEFGTPAFNQAFMQIVGTWESYRKTQGWEFPFAYHTDDEIDAGDDRTRRGLVTLQTIREMGLKTMMTYIGLGDRREQSAQQVDIANFAGDVFRAEFIDERKSAGAELWTYTGSATYGFSAKGDRYFFGLFGAAIGADGVTQWPYQWPDPGWDGEIADASFKPLLGGGGVGHNYSFATPEGLLNTIGFEGIREGIDDAKYIHTLRQWIAKAMESDVPRAREAAVAAQQRLDDLIAWTHINRENVHYIGNRFLQWYEATCHKQPHAMDGADFDRIRGQWITDILALRSALGKKAPPPE